MGIFRFKLANQFFRTVPQLCELCIEDIGFHSEKYFSNSQSNEGISEVF
jgi:hypothetical protein